MAENTVEYWFPIVLTVADAVATTATPITIYLPENSKTFRSVFVDVQVQDAQTTATNVTQRNLEIQLGAAGFSAVNNTQTLTNSGEQFCHQFSGDFTSYFTSNWSGSSMTMDCRLTINTSATGSRNASVRVVVKYDYDEDTSSTRVKTVWIPLDAPTGALGTSKPGAALATIPALDTRLGEAGKNIRQVALCVQGNTETAAVTDVTLTYEIDSAGPVTFGAFEMGLNTAIWYRVSDLLSITTNATHDFFLWASAADFDHPQCFLAVTYEYDDSTSTVYEQSLLLPMEFAGVMGGPTSSDYQRAHREVWIQEPGPITTREIACLVFYDKLAAQSGVNARIGTGAFQSYTDVGATVGGGAGLMIRNDSAFTLARGRNEINCDIYNTDAADLGFNLASCWIVNYTSGKSSQGSHLHNKTHMRAMRVTGTSAAAVQSLIAATTPFFPAQYFLGSIGLRYIYTSNTTGNPAGVHVGVERLAGEGGIEWENVYESLGGTDPEVGIRQAFATARSVFNRWPGDADASRLDLDTARRWRIALGGACASFDHLELMSTYHGITYTDTTEVTGSNGGTVTLHLCRADTGERVLTQQRTGNGSVTWTWYDNTEEMFVDAYEGANYLGRSANGLFPGSP